MKIRRCNHCNMPVMKEPDKTLAIEYPYYCPTCFENRYAIETSEREEPDNNFFDEMDCEIWEEDMAMDLFIKQGGDLKKLTGPIKVWADEFAMEHGYV